MKLYFVVVGIILLTCLIKLDAQTQPLERQSNGHYIRDSVIAIFQRAIFLNENLKNSKGVVTRDSLQILSHVLERFNENFVDSARLNANNILHKESDNVLFCTYLHYIVSYENSADESIAWDIGELFIENPDIFFKIQCSITEREKDIVRKQIKFGIHNWKYQINDRKAKIDIAEKKFEGF